ncbi:methyl-accepting chemotaxis protein [Saccharicrinis aurantiacus]|uniref:methyl-accepting chemotaxis protein n=1 Tax=Saccharicrinis aurantiacus TaxID=1849719 RepID=UPI0009FAA9DF|nr:methyl-accepting chemotaxis protein [Saccharicrinis aurantiacus]
MMNWNNLKIAHKLNYSFATFLGVFILFGSIAILEQRRIIKSATSLSSTQVPSIKKASEMERNWQSAIFNLRSYGYSKDNDYLSDGIFYLNNSKKELGELATLLQNDKSFKTKITELQSELESFSEIVMQTKNSFKDVSDAHSIMDTAYNKLRQQCAIYLELQYKKLKKDIDKGSDKHIIKRRVDKIRLMNGVMDNIDELNNLLWKAELNHKPELIKNTDDYFETIHQNIEYIRPITTKLYDIETLNTMQASSNNYKEALSILYKKWEDNHRLSSNEVMATGIALTQKLNENLFESVHKASEKNNLFARSSQRILIWGVAIVIIIGLLLSRILTNSFTRPIYQLMEYAQLQAKGKLNSSFEFNQKDEIGELAKYIHNSNEKIKQMVIKLSGLSNTINKMSQRFSNKAANLTKHSNSQASSSEELSAAMEEMSSLISLSSGNAQNMAKRGTESAEKLKLELKETQAAIEVMDQLMGKSSDIKGIAMQTNILALNASIEAAKAGNVGKGFGVVANGIRDLAAKAQQVSSEITSISSKGKEHSNIVESSIKRIYSDSQQSVTSIQDIADSAMEQESETIQITSAVSEFNNHTQRIAAMAEEISAESDILFKESIEMQEMLNFFTVQGNQIIKKKKKKKKKKSKQKPMGESRVKLGKISESVKGIKIKSPEKEVVS